MTLEELEQIRVKYKNNILLSIGIAVFLVLTTLLFFFINKLYDIVPVAFIFALISGAIIGGIITSSTAIVYTKVYKDYFVKKEFFEAQETKREDVKMEF